MKTEEKASLPEPARGHDVFVSYSRADRERVLALTQGLAARGKRAWVDLEDIPPSGEWMAEIRAAIEAADGYLVVVSPALAGSTVCAEELEHARAAGKRIVPVQVRATDPDSVPQTLAALNWIDATGPDLDAALDRIVIALETDLEYTKATTKDSVPSGREAFAYARYAPKLRSPLSTGSRYGSSGYLGLRMTDPQLSNGSEASRPCPTPTGGRASWRNAR